MKTGAGVQGSSIGRYDDNGRWMPGQARRPSRRPTGVWIADPVSGYYDKRPLGSWVRPKAITDARGQWHSTGGVRGGNVRDEPQRQRP